jgi:biotin carboxylase
MLARASVPCPSFRTFSIEEDPAVAASRVRFPCVIKPLVLSASRGVIRANDEAEFLTAYRRVATLLRDPGVARRVGEDSRRLLVEDYVPGVEVALEGLLTDGVLRMLALFDKPDPLEGPFFEESIYVTPSRLPAPVQKRILECAGRAARALGLSRGPVHAELRVNDDGPWVIEMAARSIGGLCSRTLRFGMGVSLEELILRHGTGGDISRLAREERPAGVMMIPIPQAGTLQEVRGRNAALQVAGIEEVTITAHVGQELVPLPEGHQYLGFIFARGMTPVAVEAALRVAHSKLEFVFTSSQRR